MSFLFYVNMQKRSKPPVYADLHKTDGRMYFTPDEAQAAIDSDPLTAPHRHVVAMVAMTDMELRDMHDRLERMLDHKHARQRPGPGMNG